MENVKAERINSLPAAENSVISEPVSRLDEKMRDEKECDEVDPVPYLTFFRQLVSDTSPESPRLVASRGEVKTAAMLSAAFDSDSSNTGGKGTTLHSSTASTISQLRAIDPPLLTAAPASAKTAAALPQPGVITSDSFMTAVAEKKGKETRSEVNTILPYGAPGNGGAPQFDASVKSKVENLYTPQIRHADQDLSSLLTSEASSRPEHGETKITYTFRRWDASNRHAVEFTVPKDQLTQPVIMTPTTREVRERIDIARDTPGAPVFSLREEGEQHSNRRNVWRFYDEEET